MAGSIALKLERPGDYHKSYIEHCSTRYLAVRNFHIYCEPLKKDVEDFVYRSASYAAKLNDGNHQRVTAQTFSCQHQSKQGMRVYLCAKDEKHIISKEMDFPETPQPNPKNNLIFFISHGLQSDLFCFESIRYPMHFLAVDENLQVCLKPLKDQSAAISEAMVQFKVNFLPR